MIQKNGKTFHLTGKNTSYIMILNESNDLLHYYYGNKMHAGDYSSKIISEGRGLLCCDSEGVFLEMQAQEYPAYGYTDLRMPAYSVRNKFGNTVSRLRYSGYKIHEGVVHTISGMPSVFAGNKHADTLEITLEDKGAGLAVTLYYTVFDESDVVIRSSKITNSSDDDITVESAYSMCIDYQNFNCDVVYFPGAWTRERDFVRTHITNGVQIDIANARGGSGHAMNPFAMLCDTNATERVGNVYGFSLIYSGNHSTRVQSDQYGCVRITQGINPYEFESRLAPGQSFETPQSVVSFSNCGFGGISRQMHDLYRNNLCKSKYANTDRPILINNWEGTYFDFNHDKLMQIARKAKEAGVELFVLDDGWFGKRDDDKSSLGDWVVNRKKLPGGIDGLAKDINDLGMKFGLWFEPEMTNADSDLYRSHPDWIIQVPNIEPASGRNQFMLDLSKREVCNYIIEAVCNVLGSAKIEYVKWDYNRMMTDMPRKGYNHEYTLGLYYVLDEITGRFPDVLFEGCASGGGRFDPGMLAYSPQIWTSDNSDAIKRLWIQYSTSMCYPLSSISTHVTASPNHQLGRVTPLKTRADVAYAGTFGYELDVTQMTDDEIETLKEQIEFFKKIRGLIREGNFYRLQSPYDGNYCSWMVVSEDKSKFVLFGCRILNQPNFKDKNIVLDGLDSDKVYTDNNCGQTYGGDELMNVGIRPIYDNCDFSSFVRVFNEINE